MTIVPYNKSSCLKSQKQPQTAVLRNLVAECTNTATKIAAE